MKWLIKSTLFMMYLAFILPLTACGIQLYPSYHFKLNADDDIILNKIMEEFENKGFIRNVNHPLQIWSKDGERNLFYYNEEYKDVGMRLYRNYGYGILISFDDQSTEYCEFSDLGRNYLYIIDSMLTNMASVERFVLIKNYNEHKGSKKRCRGEGGY